MGAPSASPATTVVTPTVRAATKRNTFWILSAVFVLVIAAIALILRGGADTGGEALSATNPAPPGSMAVAEVLEQHGVTVHSPDSYATAQSQLERGASTLLVYDPHSFLDDERLETLASLSERVVLVLPGYGELTAIMPGVGQAGAAKETTLKAGCDLPAAQNAGAISGGGNGYRVTDPKADAEACFGSGKGIHSLVQLTQDGKSITALGASQVLANETVATQGNAALALNLLGAEPNLVWYLPSASDVGLTGMPTIGQLTPAWVSSVALLLICATIAAAFWRGRRFGPLVVENLPVAVRASETMDGRARLYQKSSSRQHALDALRIGTIDRVARLCGLPRAASTTEVVTRVSELTGRQQTDVAALLVDASPANDRDLIRLSDELTELEAAVTKAVST